MSPAVLLVLCGCGALLYDDRCGPVGRDASADARIRDAGGDSTGYANVALGEVRDGEKSLDWFVVSAALRHHVKAARLVTVEDTARRVLELEGVAGGATAIESRSAPYTGPPEFGFLFDGLTRDRFALVLATDLPASETILLPLHLLTFNDWGQAHCG